MCDDTILKTRGNGDIVFVIDSSDSVTEENWSTLVNGLSDSTLGYYPDTGVKLGLVV